MKGLLILTGMVLIVLGACAPAKQTAVEEPPESTSDLITAVEDLAGTWHRTKKSPFGGDYRQYNLDGTYSVADNVESLQTNPKVSGTFWFDGDMFNVQDQNGKAPWDECVASQAVGIYKIHKLADGKVKFELIEDACEMRSSLLPAADFEPAP